MNAILMNGDLEDIRNAVKMQMYYVLEHVDDTELGSIENKIAHMLTQTYTLLQILTALEAINERLKKGNY